MVDLHLNNLAFHPGQQLTGKASWQLEKEPKKIEIRLFWYTKGKGTEDAMIIDSVSVSPVSQQGSQEFNFILPKHPYSFSGVLISLIWAVELIVEPSLESARKEIVMAPNASEILI